MVLGPENDIDETEDQLFNDDTAVSRRSYELSREVVEMQRTAHALVDIVRSLQEGFDKYDVDVELQRNLRDVQPHRGRAGAE